MKQTIISILAAILVTFFLPLPVISTDGNNAASNGIIIQDANMRTGPGTDFPIITALRQGTRIYRRQHQGQWVHVDVSGMGKTGWIHSSLVGTESSTAQAFPKAIVGILDIQKVLNESKQGKAAKKRIERTQGDSRNQNTVSTEEQIIAEIIEEQIVAGIIIEIQAVVESYARSHGYTHILNKNSGAIFYHETMFDITDDIIQEYDRQMDQNG